MRRVLVAIAACAAAVCGIAPVGASAAAGTGADLAVSIAWVGQGAPHAKVGDVVTYAVTVSNRGPDGAEQVAARFNISDHFNPDAADCAAGTAGSAVECTFPTLAPSSSVTMRFTARVCCFPRGEVRDAFASATVESSTPDPVTDDNDARLTTRIVGPRGFFPPAEGS